MTSPPVPVEVVCPECGHRFRAFYRASINLDLGEVWTAAEVEEATTVACPVCSHRSDVAAIVVSWDAA